MSAMEKRYTVPSRKFFAERIIPDIHQQVEESLSNMLLTAGNISFTTDTWTADNTTQSYMGITAHWLTEDFSRHSYVLNCTPLNDRHTAQYMGAQFEQALAKWNIDRSRCHLVLRDNAANITKCFSELGISSAGCFAHTLQLAVNDGILSQRYVSDIIATSRKIVGHFKHSSSATARLQEYQKQLNVANHQLIQDVTTRWNSTFYMMERLLEQRQALALYSAENTLENLSPNQWDVMKNAVGLLYPFEEATRYVSSATVCISETYPLLAGLKTRLQTAEDDHGVKTMKAALLEALSTRFPIDYKPIYTIATVLDPRFKTRFFSEVVSAAVVGEVKTKLAAMTTQTQAAQAASAHSSANNTDDERPGTAEEPLQKKPKIAAKASLFDCLDDLLEAANTQDESTQPTSTSNAGSLELDRYLAEPLIPRTSNLSLWWNANKDRYPTLASLARTYLGAPPSSVPSERLFSTAGTIISDHRSRLLPDNAERLIFLKYNCNLIHG